MRPPLHFSDAQIAQWRRGWKILLRSRTKKKATDPLNEEQRQRNLQKGREALQRFRDKQHAMVSTAPGLHLHSTLQPQKTDDSTRTLAPTLPPLNPAALCDPQQDADGVCGALTGSLHLQRDSAWQCELGQGTKQADNPRSDAFDGEPGSSPDLHLHPTLQPRQNDDSMRTQAPTLPPLNPIALCDSEQAADCVCGALTCLLHLQSDSAWQCELS